jgi:hypothetical protein
MESVINNNDSGYSALSEEEICRSMKVNQESKTPYSDATQVRRVEEIQKSLMIWKKNVKNIKQENSHLWKAM